MTCLGTEKKLLASVNVPRRLVVDLTGEQEVADVALADVVIGLGLPDVLEPRSVVGGVEEAPDAGRGHQNLMGKRTEVNGCIPTPFVESAVFFRAELCMQKRRPRRC